MNRHGLRVVALLVLVVTAGCIGVSIDRPGGTDVALGDGTQVTVVHVVDGDTMDVRFENGTEERVRLLGVDTPETHTAVDPTEWEGVPDSAEGRACLEDWGDRASDFATSELAGRTVTLVLDPQSDGRGDYGRLLAYLAYENTTINRRLLETGHARMYDSRFSRRTTYAAIEQAAMENGTGAWACRTPSTADADPGVLSIAVHPDAEGPDGDNLDDEYVTLTNTGDDAHHLDGWTVTDAADHTYTFDGRSLDVGTSVVLYTGAGTETTEAAYWGSTRPIWNNDGDTVTVRDADGVIVAQTVY